jgi:hypothetical protein
MKVERHDTSRTEPVGHWILSQLLVMSGAALTLVTFNVILS